MSLKDCTEYVSIPLGDMPLSEESEHVEKFQKLEKDEQVSVDIEKIFKLGVCFEITYEKQEISMYENTLTSKDRKYIESVSLAFIERSGKNEVLVGVRPGDDKIQMRRRDKNDKKKTRAKYYWLCTWGIDDGETVITEIYNYVVILLNINNTGYSYTKEFLSKIPVLGEVLCRRMETSYWGWNEAELVSTLLSKHYYIDIMYDSGTLLDFLNKLAII